MLIKMTLRSKIIYIANLFFWETHQQGQQGLGCFWKPPSLLIEYEQNDIMIYFRIWNTPDIKNTNYINVFRKVLTDFSCVMCAKLIIF